MSMESLYIILVLICCLLSFLGGFIFALVKGAPIERKDRPELTEAEKRKLEKEKKEYENFLTYDGDEQG